MGKRIKNRQRSIASGQADGVQLCDKSLVRLAYWIVEPPVNERLYKVANALNSERLWAYSEPLPRSMCSYPLVTPLSES